MPVTDESIDLDLAKLARCEHTDYLFLARREKSFLFPLPSVYDAGTFENIMWQSWRGITHIPIAALHLHVTKVLDARPWGSVTLLDYQATTQDVEIFSVLPEAERERHIQLIVKRCTRQACYCSIRELIEYLKTGR